MWIRAYGCIWRTSRSGRNSAASGIDPTWMGVLRYQDNGAMTCSDGSHPRRRRSRVIKVIPSTDAWAPMKKSGSTPVRVPPRQR